MTSAQVVSVADHIAGDELAVAATAGQTTLTLNDAVDFNEAGGTCQLDDTEGVVAQIAYSKADRVANTLTVAALAASWPIGSQVQPWPLETERVAYVATLDGDDEGELITARVPFNLLDRVPVGERDLAVGEMVELARADWSYVLADVYGELPVIDSTLLDPTTLPTPPTSDGAAPGGGITPSPTPTITGMVSGLFVRWVGMTNADPVTYDVYLSTTTLGTPPLSPDFAVSTGATFVVLRVLPVDGTSLVPGVDYHVKIVARDDDGSAVASADVVGQLALAGANDIDTISADQIIAGELIAPVVVGAYIGSDDQGAPTRHWEADPDGIRLYAADGTLVVNLLTKTADPSTFAGSVIADYLSVANGALLQGASKLDRSSSLTLQLKLADPNTAPVLSEDVEGVAFDTAPGGMEPSRWGLWFDGTNYWYLSGASNSPYLVKVNTAGVELARATTVMGIDMTPFNAKQFQNAVHLGTRWYALVMNTIGDWYWCVWLDNVSGFPGATAFGKALWKNSATVGANEPYLTTDGTNLIVAWQPLGANPPIHFTTYSVSGLTFTQTADVFSGSFASGQKMRGLYVGNGDFGALRYVAAMSTDKTIGVMTFDSSGVLTNDIWNQSGARTSWTSYTGIVYDGTNFRQLVPGQKLLKYTGWQKTSGVTNQSFFVAYSWYDSNATGGNHESILSPVSRQFFVDQRWRLSVSWPPIPAGGGTDDPDTVRLYVKQAATSPGSTLANWFRQPAVTPGTTQTYLTTYDTSGGTPTKAADFLSSTAAELRASSGEPVLRGNGIPRCKLRFATATNLLDTTLSAIRFGTEDADTDNFHQAATDARNSAPDTTYDINLPFAGQYLVVSNAQFTANNAGRRQITLQLNAVTYDVATFVPVGAVGQWCSLTSVVDAAANDKLTMWVIQTSGAGLNIVTCKLSIIYLGPL